jgi:ankyrin repeat protein
MPHAGFDIDEQDGTGHSALHYACGYGETKIVKALLGARASVTCVDDDKNTPLHYAAGYGQLAAVEMLMEQCASSAMPPLRLCLLCPASSAQCKKHAAAPRCGLRPARSGGNAHGAVRFL